MSGRVWEFGPLQKRVYPRDLEAPEHLVIGLDTNTKVPGAVSAFNDLADEMINVVDLADYLGLSFPLLKYYIDKLGIPIIRRGKSLYLDEAHDPDIRLRMEGPPKGTASLSRIGAAHRLSAARLREAALSLRIEPYVTVDGVEYFTPEQQEEIVFKAYELHEDKLNERRERIAKEVAEYKKNMNKAFVAAGHRPKFGKGVDITPPDGCIRCIEASVILGVSYASVQGFMRRGRIETVTFSGINFPVLESVVKLKAEREE